MIFIISVLKRSGSIHTSPCSQRMSSVMPSAAREGTVTAATSRIKYGASKRRRSMPCLPETMISMSLSESASSRLPSENMYPAAVKRFFGDISRERSMSA